MTCLPKSRLGGADHDPQVLRAHDPLQADGTMRSSPRRDPHGLTSKASTTMTTPVEARFFDPVTWIVSVWLPAARAGEVKTASWGPSAEVNRSRAFATTVPSRITRAIPAPGPR